MGARVIGIGRTAAGDDGVGIAIVRLLERLDPRPRGLDLVELGDPTHLVDLLQTPQTVVIVDAVVGAGPSGRVMLLGADDLADENRAVISSHGVDVGAAIRLAGALAPDALTPRLHVVAVTIDAPQCGRAELSAAVQAAVPEAASMIIAMLRAAHETPEQNLGSMTDEV